MEMTKTPRGFQQLVFTDRNGQECSLQESSLATEEAIWLGINDANPIIMASKVSSEDDCSGWVKYPIHPDVLLHTRMHLTRKQVQELLPHLVKFAETGELK